MPCNFLPSTFPNRRQTLFIGPSSTSTALATVSTLILAICHQGHSIFNCNVSSVQVPSSSVCDAVSYAIPTTEIRDHHLSHYLTTSILYIYLLTIRIHLNFSLYTSYKYYSHNATFPVHRSHCNCLLGVCAKRYQLSE